MPASTKLSPRILIAFACVYFFWGSTYTAMRYGVQVVPPFVLACARYLIAGPVMLAICAARGLKLWQSRRDFALLAAIGILLLGVGNMACIWCEQYLPSGLAALLLAVIPIYVALIETALPRGEGLRARGWAGIAIGFAGLIILVSPDLVSPGLVSPGLGHAGAHASLFASVVLVLAAFGWSCGSVLSRRAKLGTSPFVAAGWEMVFGGLFCSGLLVLSGEGRHLRELRWTTQGVSSIAWLIVFGSLVGYGAYVYLLGHVPVAKVTTNSYVNPIVAVVLGAIFLHERLVPAEYAGMAAVLIAVYLVTSSRLVAAPAPLLIEPEAEPAA